MALTLLLLRHAKASWDHPGMGDFDRPLSERGRAEIAEIGAAMEAAGYGARRILCSTARRTRETLSALIPRFADEMDATFTRRLYGAEVGDLLDLLQTLGNQPSPLLMVGHNPSLHDLANLLVTEGNADARLQLAARYPTCGLAVISLPIDSWTDTGATEGALVDFLVPGRPGGNRSGDD